MDTYRYTARNPSALVAEDVAAAFADAGAAEVELRDEASSGTLLSFSIEAEDEETAAAEASRIVSSPSVAALNGGWDISVTLPGRWSTS
jgi:hypothetical protein